RGRLLAYIWHSTSTMLKDSLRVNSILQEKVDATDEFRAELEAQFEQKTEKVHKANEFLVKEKNEIQEQYTKQSLQVLSMQYELESLREFREVSTDAGVMKGTIEGQERRLNNMEMQLAKRLEELEGAREVMEQYRKRTDKVTIELQTLAEACERQTEKMKNLTPRLKRRFEGVMAKRLSEAQKKDVDRALSSGLSFDIITELIRDTHYAQFAQYLGAIPETEGMSREDLLSKLQTADTGQIEAMFGLQEEGEEHSLIIATLVHHGLSPQKVATIAMGKTENGEVIHGYSEIYGCSPKSNPSDIKKLLVKVHPSFLPFSSPFLDPHTLLRGA
ncbi:hypothetical protein CYMTET_36361, partial [Cymbomonas tetramitiformis]